MCIVLCFGNVAMSVVGSGCKHLLRCVNLNDRKWKKCIDCFEGGQKVNFYMYDFKATHSKH